jgi:hypothetical protein
MRIRLQPVAIVALLILATSAQAQVSDVTLKCQKTIKKATEKFIDKVADNIEKCLLEVQKCNTKDTPAEVDACVGKLLVAGQGKCAVGKLAGDPKYYGTGSAAANDPQAGAINRELGKFVASLGKCDLLNTNFADLNLAVPASATELADMLNGDPDNFESFGAACVGHKRVGATFKNRLALMSQLFNIDGSNIPIPLLILTNGFKTCR